MRGVEAKDLYAYRFLSALKLSPEGRAAVVTLSRCDEKDNDYKKDLWLLDPEGKKAPRQLTSDGRMGAAIWEDETHILFNAARTEEEKEKAKEGEPVTPYYRLDLGGGEAVKAFDLPFAGNIARVVRPGLYLCSGLVDLNAPDLHLADEEGRKKYMEARKEEADYEVIDESPFWSNGVGMTNKKRNGLYLYDETASQARRLTPPEMEVSCLDLQGDRLYLAGRPLAATDDYRDSLYVCDLNTGEMMVLVEAKYGYSALALLDGHLLAAATDYAAYGINENPEFYDVDLMTGEMKKLTDMDVCLGNAVLTDCAYGAGRSLKKEGGRLYFLTTVRFHTELRSIGAKGDVKIHWDRDGLISDFDVAGETCLVTGQFGMKLNEVYRLAEGDLKPLTDWNKEAFKDVYVAEPVQLSLKSCGYDIDGWVLLPKDYDAAKTYPAVLDVHGGPKCAYGDGFFHEMQMWAGMGCFVFFCNPYGGEGRGNEFAFMRDKYGTTDYQNIMDFTDAVLAAYPQIDPERLCVTGGSYGGFMTNWIVTHTDRFCCGATQRSISNWVSMYGISDIGPVFTEDQCGGGLLDEEGLAKVWAHSPLKYAADCHTPLLFIHSDMDYRCPIAEGYQLYTTLVNKGVTCRMCVFHGETHELSRSGKPKHRIRRLKEITDWFIHYAKIS